MPQDETIILPFYKLVDSVTYEIGKLREKNIDMDMYALRPHFQQLVFGFRESCEKLSIDQNQIETMVYAIVASVDEAALSFGGELSSFWMVSTLQFEYYGENMAGKNFYLHLEKLLQQPEKNDLQLYLIYRMLSLGFEGQYIGNSGEREKVIENCARALVRIHSARIPELEEIVEGTHHQEASTFYIPGWVFPLAIIIIVTLGWFINREFSKATTDTILQQVEQVKTQNRTKSKRKALPQGSGSETEPETKVE